MRNNASNDQLIQGGSNVLEDDRVEEDSERASVNSQPRIDS